jgi:hypothetical protein
MRQSLALTRCELAIGSPLRVIPTPLPTFKILLTQLRFLRIVTWSKVGNVLDCLILPALLDIRLGQYGMVATDWVDPFIFLLHRSSCQIESLTLENDHRIPDDSLLRCLHHTPSLVTLKLDGYKASSLGKRAMIQLARRVIAPNLQIIKLQYGNDSSFDDRAFVDMVASRWRLDAGAVDGQIARLRTAQVSIFHHVAINPDSLQRLAAFRNEGLYISIRDESLNRSLLSEPEDTVHPKGSISTFNM